MDLADGGRSETPGRKNDYVMALGKESPTEATISNL
jgi:hypothetical protein